MLKTLSKKIPILNKIYFRLQKEKFNEFESSEKYWIERYDKGGNSGAGSYNHLAKFKAEVINNFLLKNKIQKAIEFGCGDGNQLKYLRYPFYTGYDISHSAVKICKEAYKLDTTKKFFHIDEYANEQAELVLSLDVIFHLVEDKIFHEYMNRLFAASNKYVIIFSSNQKDERDTPLHVKHRKFTTWVEKNQPNFKLINFIPNKYPYQEGKEATTSFADFYFYQLK